MQIPLLTHRETSADPWPSTSWSAFCRATAAPDPTRLHDRSSSPQQCRALIPEFPFDTDRSPYLSDLEGMQDDRWGEL